MVPRSHLLQRRPHPKESPLSGPQANPQAKPVPLKAGDCVVWHGNAWHGSYQRQIPGIRINLAMLFNRQYIVTQEDHSPGSIPAEVRARHADDPAFLRLLGDKQAYGWKPDSDGPPYEKFELMPRTIFD